MKNVMDFETLDWEAEALRVVAAFAVEGDCHFARAFDGEIDYHYLSDSSSDGDEFVTLAGGWKMSFVYSKEAYCFYIGVDKSRDRCDFIGLLRDGTITQRDHSGHLMITLAMGLYNLGLLRPQLEALLESSFRPFTTQEKQDWTLQYQERLTGTWKNPLFEAMDWEDETRRIVAAFEVVEPCRFERLGQRSCCQAIGRYIDHDDALRLKSGFHAEVDYQREFKLFSICELDQPNNITHSCWVCIRWDGSNGGVPRRKGNKPQPAYLVNALSKALYFLDLLTPEIEDVLGTSATAHERLEWALQYEKRMGNL